MAKRKKRSRLKFDGKGWADKPSPGYEPTSLVFNQDVKLFEPPKKGVSKLSIVPYAAGEGNPNFEEGSGACERTYFVHRGIGAKNQSYVCLAETYGEKCPICEARNKLFRGDPDDVETAKQLAPKVRQLWNVYDHDNPKDGVQVLEMSYHLFGKKIKEAVEDEVDYQNFADPDEGLILKVKWTEESYAGNRFSDVKRIDFAERSPLPDKVLDGAIILDDLVKKTEYADLKSIFNQEPLDDEDDEEEDDEVEEDEDDEDLEDDEEDVDEDEDEDIEEDSEDEEDDDDLDDEDDDDFDAEDDEEEDDEEEDDLEDDEDEDDDLDDDDFEDDDEEEPPPKKRAVKRKAAKKPAKKATKRASKRPAKKASKKRGSRKR